MPAVRQQILTCTVCGQSFIGDPDDSAAVGFDFCSEGCSDAFWEEQKRRYDEEIESEMKRLKGECDA